MGEGASNPFRLPRGEKLRRALRRAFAAQRRAVLHWLATGRKAAAPPLPEAFPDWDDFHLGARAMSGRMTPLLKATWDEAGRKFAPKVGLDPDAWSVVNPHTSRMIDEAALAFCGKTNSTTSLRLDEALRRLRRELKEGVVEQGEALPELTDRVNAVFDSAQRYRARTIAQTETSRAVHAAQEQSALASGVVTGWKWLASADACPKCYAIAARAPAVRLGHDFAVIGDDPNYSRIKFPPAHPHCNCSMEEVLDTDEQPAWSDTLHQPPPATEAEIERVGADVVERYGTPYRDNRVGTKPKPRAARSSGSAGDRPAANRVDREVERARRVAAKHGVPVAPDHEAPQLLWNKFDGNPFQIDETIAYYDEVDDEIVINRSHPAWAGMRAYVQARERRGHFSSRSPDHLIRHEVGHALHYRGLSPEDVAAIWLQPLTPEEKAVATAVSDYAGAGRVEFVAEVYAGLRAGRKFGGDVMGLYERLKGPPLPPRGKGKRR